MLIFFSHIPKAGGKTLLQSFDYAYGLQNVLKIYEKPFGDVAQDEFDRLSASEIKNKSAVAGHLRMKYFLSNNYAKEEFVAGRVRLLTSIRDPIDRLISYYNFVYWNSKHPLHQNVRSADPVDFLINQPANYQLGFLRPDPSTSMDFVVSNFYVFPMSKSIDGFRNFFMNLGVDIPSLEIVNKTTELSGGKEILRRSDLEVRVLDRLKNMHREDLDFFDCVNNTYQ